MKVSEKTIFVNQAVGYVIPLHCPHRQTSEGNLLNAEILKNILF